MKQRSEAPHVKGANRRWDAEHGPHALPWWAEDRPEFYRTTRPYPSICWPARLIVASEDCVTRQSPWRGLQRESDAGPLAPDLLVECRAQLAIVTSAAPRRRAPSTVTTERHLHLVTAITQSPKRPRGRPRKFQAVAVA